MVVLNGCTLESEIGVDGTGGGLTVRLFVGPDIPQEPVCTGSACLPTGSVGF